MANGRNPGQREKLPKYSAKHPIAAIDKRVIDSDPFADLSPSSVVVLLLFARNLEKGKNGYVFVSQEDAERHGIAKKTFYRSLIDLQAHGFIFPTKRGGHGQCARYALTWLSLSKDTRDLHVATFAPCAWRDWVPDPRKNRGVKMSTSRRQKYPQGVKLGDKFTPRVGDKFTPVELNTNTHRENAHVVVPILRVKKKGVLSRLNGFDLESEAFNGVKNARRENLHETA